LRPAYPAWPVWEEAMPDAWAQLIA
jgi:hypothetical protein